MNPSKSAPVDQAEAQLRGRREVVVADIRAHLHDSDDPEQLAPSSGLDDLRDGAESDALTETDVALLGNELDELRTIDAALVRIKAGTYGMCMECGDPIPTARMKAQPSALRCLACQSKADMRKAGAPRSVL
ncbi:hypothetical protein BH11PSE11_BH11PSE11_22430 [soil metagenome]